VDRIGQSVRNGGALGWSMTYGLGKVDCPLGCPSC
jgi:hypothetical protein